MDKIDKKFEKGSVLKADELNDMVNKTNEIVDAINGIGGGGEVSVEGFIPLSRDFNDDFNDDFAR